MQIDRRLSGLGALMAASALAVPAVAAAKGEHGDKKERGKKPVVTYVLKGTVSSVALDSSTVVIQVTKANRHGRALVGEALGLKVPPRALKVRDLNGDGEKSLADVASGHDVLVQVRAPKGTPIDASVVARKLIDLEKAEEEGKKTA